MLTLKLKGSSKTRIIEAASFTVLTLDANRAQVTAHGIPEDEDRCFWVGTRGDFGDSFPEQECWYDIAFIENASGRTTEIINPTPPYSAVAPDIRAA